MVTIVVSALICLEIGLLWQRRPSKQGEPVETEENLKGSNLGGEFRNFRI